MALIVQIGNQSQNGMLLKYNYRQLKNPYLKINLLVFKILFLFLRKVFYFCTGLYLNKLCCGWIVGISLNL